MAEYRLYGTEFGLCRHALALFVQRYCGGGPEPAQPVHNAEPTSWVRPLSSRLKR